MREYLFRGKRIDNGEWVEGSLCQEGDNDAVIIESLSCYSDGFMQAFGEPVDPATVGQFTGLLDKNGKRIFEGDIVRCVDNYFVDKRIFVGTVDFADASFRIIKDEVFTFYRWQDYDVEVIGNIHDTPSFLGGAE